MAERFDLDAIEADDALLDLLAAGGETAWEAAEHDPALMVLAQLRLAVEVEDELPVESIDDPESFLARCAALNPVTDPFARKMAARGFALGVAAVAALSVSGVAAAVNGDPLSPYEKVIEKVVDGLRPETSVPKEKLDGMTIFDKSKIVRVQKDYQKKQEEQRAAKDAAEKNDLSIAGPVLLKDIFTPQPLARPTPPQVEKPTTAKDPVQPPAVDPTKPSEPGDQPTGDPTDPPTEPTTPPPSEPTSDPTTTDPTTPTPTDTTTTPTGTGETGTGDGGNGATGEEPPKNPVDEPTTAPTSIPTSVPSDSTGDTSQTGTGQTSSEDSTPADQTGEQQTTEQPAGDTTEPVTLSEVLPTPAGELTELPTRLEQYLGGSLATSAKHSSGKVALGYAKAKYEAGKHSNGMYVEGKHAAIDRAHGSMAPMTLLQILSVLNSPMTER